MGGYGCDASITCAATSSSPSVVTAPTPLIPVELLLVRLILLAARVLSFHKAFIGLSCGEDKEREQCCRVASC